MEIVIKIPKEYYNAIKAIPDNQCGFDMLIIKHGTPLPKHGRLIDEKDLSLMTVHMIDGMLVCDAPTIIEADKECKC